MKRVTIIFMLLMLLFAGLPVQTLAVEVHPDNPLAQDQNPGSMGREEANAVAARVNGVVITQKSVLILMRGMRPKKGRGGSADESSEELRQRALTLLILQELAFQKAAALGLKVERDRIDKAISELKKNLGGEEAYRKFLEKDGRTERELEAQVERGITLDLMFEKEVLNKITITDDDLKKEYERQREKYSSPEKIVIADVIFFLDISDKNSLKKAEEILKKMSEDKGRDPRDLIPDGTFIVRDLQVRKEQDPELYEEAKKLKVGEFSGVITAADSFHIIKLEKYSPEKHVPFDDVKSLLEGTLKYETRQKKVREWEAELKKGATIEIIK